MCIAKSAGLSYIFVLNRVYDVMNISNNALVLLKYIPIDGIIMKIGLSIKCV